MCNHPVEHHAPSGHRSNSSSVHSVPFVVQEAFSPALEPQHFVPAVPAGPRFSDPGPGSKALSSHVNFDTLSDFYCRSS
jgi:hypothetical protein